MPDGLACDFKHELRHVLLNPYEKQNSVILIHSVKALMESFAGNIQP